mgnify:CR=1 FL=1
MFYKLNLKKCGKPFILGRTNENPPWRHNGRSVGYNHIIVVISGSCSCNIDNRSYHAESGSIIFVPSEHFYKLTTNDHCEYFFGCFNAEVEYSNEDEAFSFEKKLHKPQKEFYLPDNDADYICLSEHFHSDKSDFCKLTSLFSRCQSLALSARYYDKLMLDLCFYEILITSANAAIFAKEEHIKPSLSLERMSAFIHENFTETITPETLAQKFDLSKEHICSLFKSGYNQTVSEYVGIVKMNHALELLSNSSMNISQIAEYLGYSSVYYFSKTFKARFGVSPSHYKVKDSI